MSGSGVIAAGSGGPLVWRRRARRWAGVVHAVGLLGCGALMMCTEGPSAPVSDNPQVLVDAAWWNVAAIVLCCAAQGAALAAWWWCSRVIRAAGGRRPGGRWGRRVCVTLLLAVPWVAEAGYFVQAVTSIRSDGWWEPLSHPALVLVAVAAWGLLAAPAAGLVTVLAIASVEVVRAILRYRASEAAAGHRPGPFGVAVRIWGASAAVGAGGLMGYNSLPAALQDAVVTWVAVVFLALPGGLLAAVLRFRDDEQPGQAVLDAAVEAERSARGHRSFPWGRWVGRVFAAALAAFAVYVTVVILPVEVNSAAYLAGAGHSAVFVPVVQDGTTCGRGGCSSTTSGYLEGSGAQANWPNTVPLGRTFPVRTVVWHFPGTENIGGDGYAVLRLLLWLMITMWDLLFVGFGIVTFRRRRPRATQSAVPSLALRIEPPGGLVDDG